MTPILLLTLTLSTATIAPAPAITCEPIPLLHTQQFETNQLTLQDPSNAELELFLQDLNRRKDYDYSQHNNHPGPDSAYLWHWVQLVTAELQSRGYTMDPASTLHRPDSTPIPMR